MPDKSVREMSRWERKRYSLAARVYHATLGGALFLGIAALILGLGLYIYAVMSQYITEAFSLSKSAASILEKVADVGPLADAVMEIYRGQSEEERKQFQTDPDAYKSRYSSVNERADYRLVRSFLSDFNGTTEMDYIYLAMYDRETGALVYIVDPDDSGRAVCTGGWENVEERELEKFLNWDGTGKLYDIGDTEEYGWLCSSGIPIRAEDGEIKAFVLVDVSLHNIRDGMKYFSLQFAIAMLILVNLYAYIHTKRMEKTLVKPINDIAQAAQDYVKDKRAGEAVTDHFALLNIRTGDEIENLSLVMADMERDLSEIEENLTQVTAEKERIHTELSLAQRIQTDMLPNTFPPFPDRTEFDIYASMKAAREVGGDFYDYFLIDDDHLCLAMADVSGKGVPAALFMMASKIILGNSAKMGHSPAQILEHTNEAICTGHLGEMFVTVWLGILELSTGRLTAANAGHEYPVLMHAGGEYELIRDKHGFVIGGFEGTRYKEYELTLEPGSSLFLYTDGIPEAMDAGDRMFGTERMLAALNQDKEADVKQTLTNVAEAVKKFVRGAEQFDDMTMLCLKYSGTVPENGRRRIIMQDELLIEASVDNLPKVQEFLENLLEKTGCRPKTQMQISVAVEEIFVNIALYAYAPEKGDATVRVEVLEDPAVVITFIDRGVPFNPLEKEDPDVGLPAAKRGIGGLGIFMTKKSMDTVEYEYKDGQNILRLKKNL